MENLMQGLFDLGLAQQIRASLYAFPLIEAAHVIAITLVFGTISIVDLRLLGVASGHRPYTKLSSELLKWTWIAFALAVITGGLDVHLQRGGLLQQHPVPDQDGPDAAGRHQHGRSSSCSPSAR